MTSLFDNINIKEDRRGKKKKQEIEHDPIVYGYARTSKDESDIETQELEIIAYCDKNNIQLKEVITDDGISGYKTDRIDRKLHHMICNICMKGDTIVIYDITRMARKMIDIYILADECIKKGILLIAIKNGLIFDGSINAKTLLSAFGIAAEIERHMISERTKSKLAKIQNDIKLGKPILNSEGIELKKYIGICGQVRTIKKEINGQKIEVQIPRKGTFYKSQIFDDKKELIIERLKQGKTQIDICKEFNLKAPALSKYISRYNLKSNILQDS